jgi:hypothetical protein
MRIDRQLSTHTDVLEAIDGRLTLHENVEAIQIDISDTGSADVEFTVTHNLGKIPRHYIYNTSLGGVVYDSRRTAWTTELMFLKCTVPNAALVMTVL